MEMYDIEMYGQHMKSPKGFVAKVCKGTYLHRFGGNSWKIQDVNQIGYGPTLLLVLDCNDPKVRGGISDVLDELPLCAYLNCVSIEKQIYRINKENREIVLEKHEEKSVEVLESKDQLPNPLPEKHLDLREMRENEYPYDEDAYYKCCDNFLGGDSVIRVMGPPIWLQWTVKETCTCGREMDYICSIGYEVDNKSRQLMDAEPFFPGELAHYLFLCKSCLRLNVITQST